MTEPNRPIEDLAHYAMRRAINETASSRLNEQVISGNEERLAGRVDAIGAPREEVEPPESP